MDYEQYTINETPVEEETETKNEIVPVETEEPEEKKSGNTAAGVAIGALLTIGVFAAVNGAKKVIKHVKAKAAAKKAEAHEDDEWEDEPDEDEVVVEETTAEKKPEKK